MWPNQVPFPVLLLLFLFLLTKNASAVDFLFDSFNRSDNLQLVRDSWLDSPVIRFTNDSSPSSIGRAIYPSPLPMRSSTSGNVSSINSFSTSFIFSILSESSDLPGFGMAFFLSNLTDPPGPLSGQYFGLFLNTTRQSITPLLVVEFDTGRNPEFNDPDDNHVGIDIDNILPRVTNTAGYWNESEFVPVVMRSGQNIRAWIDFNGQDLQINVTMAPVGVPRPSRPLLSYADPSIADYITGEMFVGFSASKVTETGGTWGEQQRLLAWSLSNEGRPARELTITNLPVFLPESKSESSSPLSSGAIAGIIIGVLVLVGLCAGAVYWIWWRRWLGRKEEADMVEDWELEYWPHRFSYEELSAATNGFAKERLLGFGGFGKVYKGVLLRLNSSSGSEIAVKCIAHDSKQGLREFMAEISSMGRLQHKNLVPMRGWCRKDNELLLVYDYMPNGSLNQRIFDNPDELLGWEGRLRVLANVAEGLVYLHHGWDQMVIHRDIKSSNILLDEQMRGKLGDFGLAKVFKHGKAPDSTRIVGTLGYMAPELATVGTPTAASDIYSFGVVVLEVASGRRPIQPSAKVTVLVDLVRELYAAGRIVEAADERLKGQYGPEEMEKVLKLGLTCCHPNPVQRPNMKDVAAVLLGEVGEPDAEILSGLTHGSTPEPST